MNFSKRQGKVRFQIFPYIFVTHEILFKINVTGEFFLKFLFKMESGTPLSLLLLVSSCMYMYSHTVQLHDLCGIQLCQASGNELK